MEQIGGGVLHNGSLLGPSFLQVLENSLRNGKSNSNGKSTSFLKATDSSSVGVLGLNDKDLELNTDPSFFSALAFVRKFVLRDQEAVSKRGSLIKWFSNSNLEPESQELIEDGLHSKQNEKIPQIPQVVVISLRSIFDLIQESKRSHPELCRKVLKALFGILQNLLPESLKNEPLHVVEPLFDLLLCMSLDDDNERNPENRDQDVEESLNSVASACLLSLGVAWGVTPKILRALNHLITVDQPLTAQEITLPKILVVLQKGVQSMIIGTTSIPDWFAHGIQRSTLTTSFPVSLERGPTPTSISCDGSYIYLLCSQEIYKIGTGYGGTTGGQIYCASKFLSHGNTRNLLIVNEQLFILCEIGAESHLFLVDRDTLTVEKRLKSFDGAAYSGVLCSDGEQLANVCKTEEDELFASLLKVSDGEVCHTDVCRLRLALQSLYVFGTSIFEDKTDMRPIGFNSEDGFSEIAAGKEFIIMISASGKVSYQGKGSTLGLKNPSSEVMPGSENSYSRWHELPLPKGPSIVRCSAGHEGQHAVMIDSNGSAYFVGLAKRGEDGDITKHRRQAKTSRLKRFSSMEGKTVVFAACNNGTSALVTKEGELYLFGKDSGYCDASTGRLLGINKEMQIIAVALGKAHGLALTNSGSVYTFGINNKGQCGRDGPPFPSQRKSTEGNFSLAEISSLHDVVTEDESEDSAVEFKMCPSGEHCWMLDQCMVCTSCHQCSGFGNTCVNTNSPGRLPGTLCGCGSGDSGCSRCGICRPCARDPNGVGAESIGLPPAPVPILPFGRGNGPAAANGAVLIGRFVRAPSNAFSNAALMANFRIPPKREVDDPKLRDGVRVEALIGGAMNGDPSVEGNRRQHRHSHRRRHPSEAKIAAMARDVPKAFDHKKINAAHLLKSGSDVAPGSDGDREANKLASLSPGLVNLPERVKITQIACGLHHSVMLTSEGQVYTFGSNSYGQLGVGDLSSRGSPTLAKIPPSLKIVMVTAGSHHSVALSSDGDVLTWGAHLKGQLARDISELEASSIPVNLKCSLPGFVKEIGSKRGRRATWIGAYGDQTFMKLDESLVTDEQFEQSTILASNDYFVILPTQSNLSSQNLVISRNDGKCRNFSGPEQVNFSNNLVTWDPVYGVLWSVCKNSMIIRAYNVHASSLVHPSMGDSLLPVSNELEPVQVADIFRPALALPVISTAKVTRAQAALHLLCCLDSLTRCQQVPLNEATSQDAKTLLSSRCHSKEDYSVVNRFESHGGGWGYSGHSVEAVRFTPDSDIELGGFSLFGGRGEYGGKIKVFDLGPSGGEQEGDGELLAETDEVIYECGARQRHPILFPQPIRLQANRWYLAWARVNGPSSDCGSGGQSSVTTDDQVTFTFKSSKKSNNGTDVNAGQIPQILFRIITHDAHFSKPHTVRDVVHAISRSFSKAVSPDSFAALLSLSHWAWSVLKVQAVKSMEIQGYDSEEHSSDDIQDVSRMVFVYRVSMRLLRFYILELYPCKSKQSKRLTNESEGMAKAIVDVRMMLESILSDPVIGEWKKYQTSQMPKLFSSSPLEVMLEQVVKESHDTFVACFHVFFPTSALKWTILCKLLDQVQKVAHNPENSDRLLGAVLDSLCSLHVRLRIALPNICDLQEILHSRQAYQSPEMEKIPSLNSPSENGSESPTLHMPDINHYPVLVEHMIEGQSFINRPCRAVLDRLYLIATWPVRQALENDVIIWSDDLVQFACRLLARVVAELAAQVSTSEVLDASTTRAVQTTPSRFSSVSQNRSWNTGNGSPDAICFTVDRPNVYIVGAGVFGGGGNYTYELELLELMRSSGDSAQTLSWHSLAVVRGSYSPDDCVNDMAEIKFDRPVAIKESTRYTLRLRNQGGKTHNGDGGVTSVKGPDGTCFTFSACLLSFNGTNHIRGQLPFILYCNMPSSVEIQQSIRSVMESQARKSVMSITSSIVRCTADLLSAARSLPVHRSLPIVTKSCVISYLLPFVVANVGVVAESDPKNAVQILELIRVLLPNVSALCLADIMALKIKRSNDDSPDEGDPCVTTSSHVVSVESEHPYRPATVSHYRVCFPKTVRWMCLEFDSQCCTSQVEDYLQLFLPSANPKTRGHAFNISDYWPVLRKFSGSDNWPSNSLLLPGNEVIFSLETASDYVRGDKASAWGFRCSVIGYELQETTNSIRQLETELSYLGGMCAASLMKRDLSLQSNGDVNDVESVEAITRLIYEQHSSLLGRGIALSRLPTVQEALEGNLPFSISGKERQFLRDFVSASEDTSGGRLARWLQPEPVIDPAKSQLIFPGVFSANIGTFGGSTSTLAPVASGTFGNTLAPGPPRSPSRTSDDDNDIESTQSISSFPGKSSVSPTATVVSEGLRAGWPSVLTLLTRDQYSHLVHVPNLKVNIRAVPCDISLPLPSNKSLSTVKRVSSNEESHNLDGLSNPALEVPYEVTIKDRMCLHAITFLKTYEDYSFEELRFMSPTKRRTSETMLVRSNVDGSYSANWTPTAPGRYTIYVTIDGYPLDEIYEVDVKDPPQGVLPPSQHVTVRNNTAPNNRVRQFRTRASAGLRVRAQPSLQGEQIGIVACEGTITFVEELCNDDGTWLRLSMESVKDWCYSQYVEAWCLQFNQHLGKTLLFPVTGADSLEKEIVDYSQRKNKKTSDVLESTVYPTAQTFYVVDCGASGHNIRAQPSLKALPVGKLKLGCSFLVTEQRHTLEGRWVRLLPSSAQQFCSSLEGEAWSLSIDRHQVVYLRHEEEVLSVSAGSEKSEFISAKAAYDFSDSIDRRANLAAFSSSDSLTATFIFGPEKDPGLPSSPNTATPLLNECEGSKDITLSDEIVLTTDSIISSPQDKDPKSETTPSNEPSSPLASVATGPLSAFQNWLRRDVSASKAPKDIPSSPTTSRRAVPPELEGVSVKDLVRVMGESRSNGNASPSSSPKMMRKSGAVSISSRSLSANPSSLSDEKIEASSVSDTLQRSRSLSPATTGNITKASAPSVKSKTMSQAGTQTSPEPNKNPHFNLGSEASPEVSRSPHRLSPKTTRNKERLSRGGAKTRKPRSPTVGAQQVTNRSFVLDQEKACIGMSPSTAECFRAVFAANLWHQGLVHDAMACASFLKFHPNLPKQVDAVVLRRDQRIWKSREEKARQRHSVEILSSNVLTGPFSSALPVAVEESWNVDKAESTTGLVQTTLCDNKAGPSLTPTLSLLVEFWEKLSEHCAEIIQADAIAPFSSICTTRSHVDANSGTKVSLKAESRDSREKERKRKSRKESLRPESNCELCGGLFPVPVTVHMRQAHPGCQKPALGLGYNPAGHYCGGWVGNCGEGGVQGSSWYLLCEDCRHRYLQQRRQVGEAFAGKEEKGKRVRRRSSTSLSTPPAQLLRSLSPTEAHMTLKENALFLLQLASFSGSEKSQLMFDRRRRSFMHQPSLSAVVESVGNPMTSIPQRKSSAPPPKSEYSSTDCFPSMRFQSLSVLKTGCSSQYANNYAVFENADPDLNLDEGRGIKESPDVLGRHMHRSVSMITQPLAEHLRSNPEYNISSDGTSQRRRTNSAEEQGVDGGLALLRSPSKALQDTVKLISLWPDQDHNDRNSSLPVLDFVSKRHDLVSLRFSMELALRKAACRVFAMENLSWLLQNVTQPVCLHDLLWWLVSSLAPASSSSSEALSPKEKSEFVDSDATTKRDNLVGQHPTTDVGLAGEELAPLLHSFHGLLQTVSNLMQLLPMGTPLLTMAVRCWDIRFKQTDHAFLHKSHVFSNISRILSRCEEEIAVENESIENLVQQSSFVTMLVDAVENVEVKVSSRSAMVSSLTDGSTETFWESGDEDRGRLKLITLHISPESVGDVPRIICAYIDNGRDAGCKVSGVTFKAGPSVEELQIVDVQDVESRFAGWLRAYLSPGVHVIQLELKGPDNSLRVRQLRLLGGGLSRSFNASAIHQRTCETETMRVFRLLTSQVFGRLLSNESDTSPLRSESLGDLDIDGEVIERDIDLREHMVGILFSGKKLTALTHLQRQVCTHILHGIQRETIRLREEWETLLQFDSTPGCDIVGQDAYISCRISDSYCFELLSQVLALSGSRVGRTYISQQTTLPADLLSLLHTGSPRIQRQVTALLRRVLPELPPPTFASLIGVDVLPSTDYGILQVLNSVGTVDRTGILDVFLACIAKSLTLQVKTKGRDKELSKNPITSVTMSSIFNSQQPQLQQQLGSRWWMRGSMPRRVAESIIQLVRDMASGSLSEMWSAVTKASIAEAVLNLTKLDEERRGSIDCLKMPSLWLTLAALCLLQDEHVERLSSTQWSRGAVDKPQCANHDDGETGAQIVCSECGPLCIDCDRVLHLSRKFRSHQRQVCKEEEEAIKVDVHEGCGRVKLFWILALSDARNLKSLVEFRHGAAGVVLGNVTTTVSGSFDGGGRSSIMPITGLVSMSTCRYCGSPLSPSAASLFDDPLVNVCSEPDCQEHLKNACMKTHSCGHPCGGVRNESECLPCLLRCSEKITLKQDADDMCMICFTEALSAAPAIQLSCMHVFHAHCCRSVLSRKWPGPRITFSFSSCPICKAEMRNEFLDDLLSPIRELFNDVKRKALMRLEYEGLHKAEAITLPGSRFYQDPEGFAMERYAYYVCFKCNKAYYGGEARCEAELGMGAEGGGPGAVPGGESFNPTELVCGGCSDVSRAQMCPRHGADYLEYKCRYCCSVAVFFCFGTTHFCNACHEDFRHVTEMPKHTLPRCPAGPRGRQLDGDECPLHLVHPQTGEEFALGCGICRNAHTF